MVDFDTELIGVIAQGLRCGEQIRTGVRKREEAQQVFRNLVELLWRHQVVWVGRIGKNVKELVLRIVAEATREALGAKFGKVAGTLLHATERW